jgi:hypothetical protein
MPRESIPKLANDPAARSRVVNVTDLRAGLPKLYFDPQVSDEKETQWSGYTSCQAQLCPSTGPQPGGYACEADGAGALIPYVSVPADSTEREPPELPRHVRVNPRERPIINGKVTKLSDCSAVQQALDDHGAGGTKDPDLNHEIRLPPGAICRPEQESSRAGKNLANYTLPAKTGAGVTIITCDWAPLEGPPPGVQYAPDLRTDRSCGFGLNLRAVRDGSAFQSPGGLFTTARCPAPPCTRGWRFETLVFEAGDWRSFSIRKVPVRSVDVTNGRITLAEPIGDLYASNTEMVLNLPGIRTMVLGQGAKPHADFNQRGCMAAKLSGTELACSGVERMTGEYKGGGYVTAAQGYPIESCTAEEKAVTCTLSDAHGLGDFHSFQVAGLKDGLLEIEEAGHGWTKGAAVLIQATRPATVFTTSMRRRIRAPPSSPATLAAEREEPSAVSIPGASSISKAPGPRLSKAYIWSISQPPTGYAHSMSPLTQRRSKAAALSTPTPRSTTSSPCGMRPASHGTASCSTSARPSGSST